MAGLEPKEQDRLNNYYLPEALERQIDAFVNHYNTIRYHESLNSLTPYDVFTGQGSAILQKRNRIEEKTMVLRKQLHFKKRRPNINPEEPEYHLYLLSSVPEFI